MKCLPLGAILVNTALYSRERVHCSESFFGDAYKDTDFVILSDNCAPLTAIFHHKYVQRTTLHHNIKLFEIKIIETVKIGFIYLFIAF